MKDHKKKKTPHHKSEDISKELSDTQVSEVTEETVEQNEGTMIKKEKGKKKEEDTTEVKEKREKKSSKDSEKKEHQHTNKKEKNESSELNKEEPDHKKDSNEKNKGHKK